MDTGAFGTNVQRGFRSPRLESMPSQLLELKRSLHLVPTEAMQFAMTVLAMPWHEMETRLLKELQENIVVEESSPGEMEITLEEQEGYYRSRRAKGARKKDQEEPGEHLEQLAGGVSLAEQLHRQIGEHFRSEAEQAAARWIVGHLNEQGYLAGTVEEVAQSGGWEVSFLESVRQQVMRFTPVGCGATGLGECLAIQVLERWGENGKFLAKAMLERPRRLLSMEFMEREARRVGLNSREALFSELRRLHPSPGMQYGYETPYTPPVDIRFHEQQGKWTIEVTDPDLGGWRLRPEYHPRTLDSETRRFLAPYFRQLRFWRYALRLRRDTLEQMARWLLEHQMDFVRHGPRFLKPATMTEAAGQMGVSISTVSRCVHNKMLHFAWGTFPFREVFRDIRMQRKGEQPETGSGNVTGASGMPSCLYFPGSPRLPAESGPKPAESSRRQVHEHTVREALLNILAEESAQLVYPDEVLTEKLRQQGIVISRRCLSRYRQRWGIGHRGERLLQYRMRAGQTLSINGAGDKDSQAAPKPEA